MREQLAKYLETAQKAKEAAAATARDPLGPQVVFPSKALTLTREQEDILVRTALRRKSEIEDEMGTESSASYQAGARDVNMFVNLRNSWMARRELYEKMYEGDVEWREWAFPEGGNIFAEHNINLPMTRKIVQQQHSRAQNYFFDVDPWLAIVPLQEVDPELAERHDRFLKFKARQSGLKNCFTSALKQAFINGEAVLKGTLEVRDDIYEDVDRVAIDEASGEPLLAGDGDYIFEDDSWIPVQSEDGQFLNLDMDPVASADEAAWVLERHQSTVRPPNIQFAEKKIRRQLTHYKGADLDLVYYKDFLCPLTAKSIDEADCVIHLYDTSAVDLVQKYMASSNGNVIHDPAFLEMVQGMASEDGQAKSSDRQRWDDRQSGDRGDALIQIGEFYMHIDLGDGFRRNILMVLDIKRQRPIYYDYVARVCSGDGRRPFRVLRVNPVANRWYGASQVGLFWGLQEWLDLTANRLNKSQSDSARVTFWNPAAVVEGDNNPLLKLNNGGTYTLKPNYTVEQALSTVLLADVKHDILTNLMQIIQQFAISLAGVTSANDSQMAGLDSSRLATGIRQIEKVGQEMFGPLLDDLIPGVQEAVEMFFKITVANLDQDEVFDFFRDGQRVFDTMKPKEVQSLDFTVEIELTTYKGEQELVQRQSALDIIERFYSWPIAIQQRVAPLVLDTLKLLQIPNAEQIIDPMDPQMPPRRPRQIPELAAQPKPNRPEPNL